jgi:hypothetical protein
VFFRGPAKKCKATDLIEPIREGKRLRGARTNTEKHGRCLFAFRPTPSKNRFPQDSSKATEEHGKRGGGAGRLNKSDSACLPLKISNPLLFRVRPWLSTRHAYAVAQMKGSASDQTQHPCLFRVRPWPSTRQSTREGKNLRGARTNTEKHGKWISAFRLLAIEELIASGLFKGHGRTRKKRGEAQEG